MSKELDVFYKVKNKLIKVEGNTTYGSITDLTNLDIIEKGLKALEIIKNYTYSGGWSGDYTTRYWDMKQKEIKIVDEAFEDIF